MNNGQSTDPGSSRNPDFSNQTEAYLTETLTPEQKKDFIAEMKRDPVFRLRVIKARTTLEATDMPVSEKAATLMSLVTSALLQGNLHFPGHSYISGMENRADMPEHRKRYYGEAIDRCEELLERGELEDLALENKARAERNLTAGLAAQKFYGPSSSESGFFGFVASSSGQDLNVTEAPHWLDPVYLSAKPASPIDLEAELNTSGFRETEFNTLIRGLPEQFPRFAEDGYIMGSRANDPLNSPEVRAAFLDKLSSDPEALQLLENYLHTPLMGAKPEREVAGRAAAAKLLVAHHLTTEEASSLDSVITLASSLLEKNITNSLSKHTATLLETLLELTSHESDQSDSTWQALKPVLLAALDAENYGFDKEVRSYGALDILETLNNLKTRMLSDPELHDTIIGFAKSRKSDLAYAVLEATASLPTEESVPLMMKHMSREWDFYEKKDGFDMFGNPSSLRQRTARMFRKLNSEEIKKITFSLHGFPRKIRGQLNAEKALSGIILKRLNNENVASGNVDFEINAIEALRLYNSEKADYLFCRLVAKTQYPNDHIAHDYLNYFKDHQKDLKRSNGAENKLIKLLGKMKADGIFEKDKIQVAIEILESWGKSKADIVTDLANGEPDQNTMLLLNRYFPESQPLEYFRKALISEDVYIRIQGIRLLSDKQYAESITKEDIKAIGLSLGNTKSVGMGFISRDSSEAEKASNALVSIGQGSARELAIDSLIELGKEITELKDQDSVTALRHNLRKTIQSIMDEKSAESFSIIDNFDMAAVNALIELLGRE